MARADGVRASSGGSAGASVAVSPRPPAEYGPQMRPVTAYRRSKRITGRIYHKSDVFLLPPSIPPDGGFKAPQGHVMKAI